MKLTKKPLLVRLQVRLRALAGGHPAHPEYVPAVLRAVADMPITAYLDQYPEELERLAKLMNYPLHYMEELSYAAIAARIRDLHGQDAPAARDAMVILAAPLAAMYPNRSEGREEHG